MQFEIKEYSQPYDPQRPKAVSFKNIIGYIILVILGPIILILILIFIIIQKLRGNPKPPTMQPDILYDYKNFNGHQLQRMLVNKGLPNDLDFHYEDDYYLYKIVSQQHLPEIEEKFFRNQELETPNGLYLITMNKAGQGNTLYCIDKNTLQLYKVKDLTRQRWIMTQKKGLVRLQAHDNKMEYNITVKEKT